MTAKQLALTQKVVTHHLVAVYNLPTSGYVLLQNVCRLYMSGTSDLRLPALLTRSLISHTWPAYRVSTHNYNDVLVV